MADAKPPVWPVVLGATVLAGLGVGWYALSRMVMHTTSADAAGEALGVALALLIVVSVVGAIRRRP
jgi:hypothetical protein